MKKNDMQAQLEYSFLSGANANYLEAMYESFLTDTESVQQPWQATFSSLSTRNGVSSAEVPHSPIRAHFRELAQQTRRRHRAAVGDLDHEFMDKQIKVLNLVNAFRSYGHHRSDLDPLGLSQRRSIAALDPGYYGLTAADLETQFNSGLVMFPHAEKLSSIIGTLEQSYCGKYGVEYMHISNTAQVKWLQERLEVVEPLNCFSNDEKQHIFDRVLAAELFEKYLAKRYVGQKRFGLDGGESFIPLLHEVIQRSGKHGAQEVVLAMAHRGRLNVLVNVMGKSTQELFNEFEGKSTNQNYSGDVKYHMGISSDIETAGGPVHVSLSFNPSHLEIICPVALGSVRARLERRGNSGLYNQVVPILVHGDAAIAGQGVVMELFALSQAEGYSTGGAIHIVTNNQIGFTTNNPIDSHSSLYCSDIAKIVQAPIFHVNGDDPEAVVFVTRLAIDFRERFKKDVVIDLVCYRRFGHNEADEPSGTSPLMYKAIKAHPTVAQLYKDKLLKSKVFDEQHYAELNQNYRDKLDTGERLYPLLEKNSANQHPIDWSSYILQDWYGVYETAVAEQALTTLATELFTLPEHIQLQPQVKRVYQDRLKMIAGQLPINWGFAEMLAYASLVVDGTPIRLAGQDTCRGTFSHRHAILHDQETGATYTPLNELSAREAEFKVYNTILSEEAVLAFEYGFSTASPDTLVLWEAQFGDFANGAQVVIDQFISSGEQKWGRLSGLVLLLPHGYEGQGPEHSSARLERFLQLCAQQNMQVCIPTTPAQIFHLLRLQVKRNARAPLVVFTPKSLLRHKLATSSMIDLASGGFQLIIPEVDDIAPAKVRKVIICGGRVYYDLLEARRAQAIEDIAIMRVEQLYPFPTSELQNLLAQYQNLKQIVWCQEEPKNQGAWHRIQHNILRVLGDDQNLSYAGRPYSASPAAGYLYIHREQQESLVREALA